MAIRQNVGIGGLYPTGRAPLAVDLATPTAAITQRMIKREEQRIAGEKEQISANQQAILKALDFETVQGLSDKIQTEHLENLNKVWNNWAEKFASKQGKLSFADLKELQDDKRKIESNLGKMQADVKTFAFAQNELSKPNARQLWDEQSWLNLKDYANQGKVGSGDAINILVPRQPSFMEYLQSTYKTQLAGLDKKISNRWIGVTDEGRVSAQKDNLDAANNMWESLKQQPDVKQYIGQIGETQAKEQFLNAYGFSVKDDYFSQGVWKEARKGAEGSTLTPEQQSFMKEHNIKDPALVGTAMHAAQTLERIMVADKGAIDNLQTTFIPQFGGNPEKIDYDNPQASGVVLQFSEEGPVYKFRKGKKRYEKQLGYSYPNEITRKNHKLNFLGDKGETPEVLTGKQEVKGISDAILSEQALYEPAEIAYPTAYDRFLKDIDNLELNAEQLMAPISNEFWGMLPDADIEKEDKNTIKFNGKSYKVNNKGIFGGKEEEVKKGREDLKKAVIQEVEEKRDLLRQQVKYKEDTQQREENIESMDKLVEAARQDAVSLAKKNNLKSLQEFKDFKLSVGLREEDIDRAIEQLGLTDEDFQ